MRKAEELSTTTAPAFTATGAKRFDCAPPAENSAMSTPFRLSSVSSCTATSAPRNFMVLTTERAEARRRSSASGNLRCSRHCISSTPTAPVAPAMATTGILLLRTVSSLDDISSLLQKKGPAGFSSRGLRCSCRKAVVTRANPRPQRAWSWWSLCGPCESWGAKHSGAALRRKAKYARIPHFFRELCPGGLDQAEIPGGHQDQEQRQGQADAHGERPGHLAGV